MPEKDIENLPHGGDSRSFTVLAEWLRENRKAIERELAAQNAATAQHREWEGQTLTALKGESAEIKALAEQTNGRVNKHDVELGIIKEAERQAAIIQAAKVEAEAVLKANRLQWKQGITFGVVGAVASSALLGILYLTGVA
jgi:hypothetical protein